MIKLLFLAAGAASPAVAQVESRYPEMDVLFDCELREAADARLPLGSWTPKSASVERSVWFLPGMESLLRAPDDTAGMQYRGSSLVFDNDGIFRTHVDWPQRVEFGTSRLTGREAQGRDEFETLDIDLTSHRTRVAVVNYEWPHGGGDDDWFVTGGYFGECVLLEGKAAIRKFGDIE